MKPSLLPLHFNGVTSMLEFIHLPNYNEQVDAMQSKAATRLGNTLAALSRSGSLHLSEAFNKSFQDNIHLKQRSGKAAI